MFKSLEWNWFQTGKLVTGIQNQFLNDQYKELVANQVKVLTVFNAARLAFFKVVE